MLSLSTDPAGKSGDRRVCNHEDGDYQNCDRNDKQSRHAEKLGKNGTYLHAYHAAHFTVNAVNIEIHDIPET